MLPEMLPAHRVMLEVALKRSRDRGGRVRMRTLGDGAGAAPGRATGHTVSHTVSVLDWLVSPKRHAMLDNQIDAHPSLCYVEQDPARARMRRGRLVSVAVYGTSKSALDGDKDPVCGGNPFIMLRAWDADVVLPRATAVPKGEQAVSLLRRMPFRTSDAGVGDASGAPPLVADRYAHVMPGGVREFARRGYWQFSQRLDKHSGPLKRFSVVDGRCWVRLGRPAAEAAVRALDESWKKGMMPKRRVFEHPDDPSSVLIGTQGRETDDEVMTWVCRTYPVGFTFSSYSAHLCQESCSSSNTNCLN